MIKKIALIACITMGYAGHCQAMDVQPNPNQGSFEIPKGFTFKLEGPDKPVPLEFTVSPGTLFAIAGLLGLYQTTSLLKEGIQKYSDPDSVKQAEGKRILMYSSILLAGSAMAILSKLIPFLK